VNEKSGQTLTFNKGKVSSGIRYLHMNSKCVMKIAFIIWMMAITVLSVLPHSDKGILSYKLTGSGMFIHFVVYFVAAGLMYWINRRDSIPFILFCGLIIFMFSVILESVQLWLPARTFNPLDIAANAGGIVLFILLWAGDQRFVKIKRNVFDSPVK